MNQQIRNKFNKVFVICAALIILVLEIALLGNAFFNQNIFSIVLGSVVTVIVGLLIAYLIVFSLLRPNILALDASNEEIKVSAKTDSALPPTKPQTYAEQKTQGIEEELDNLRVQVSEMPKFFESLSSAITTNDVIRNLAGGLSSIPNIDASAILLVNKEKNSAVFHPVFSKEKLFLRKEYILGEEGLALSRLKLDASVYRERLSEVAAPNELEATFIEKGYQSCYTVPITNEGTFFGLLAAGSKEQLGIPKEYLAFINSLASLIGLKLAKIQLNYDFKQVKEEVVEIKHSGKKKVEEEIAELKVAYSQIVQQGKMNSLGLLSAGVAHELNNPIGGILGYTQLIMSKLRAPKFTKEDLENCIKYLELMEKDSKRCQWIISNLLNFARKPLDERMSIDIADVIKNTIGMIEYQLDKANVKISLSLPTEGLKKIMGNANELQQVFTNLVQNAQDAMPEGGQITISARNKSERQYGYSAEYVEVSFSDTGCGISKENLVRIFDPFFSSKQGKPGTGLGLSISYTIVSSHGGLIKVESEEGKGTTFTITLPAIKEKSA